MSKDAAHTTTPQESTSGKDTTPSIDEVVYQRNLYMMMALNMSWQLAMVVIIPIVGGHLLDQKLSSSPWFTLLGLIFSALGVFVVLRHIVRIANARAAQSPKGKA